MTHRSKILKFILTFSAQTHLSNVGQRPLLATNYLKQYVRTTKLHYKDGTQEEQYNMTAPWDMKCI